MDIRLAMAILENREMREMAHQVNEHLRQARDRKEDFRRIQQTYLGRVPAY